MKIFGLTALVLMLVAPAGATTNTYQEGVSGPATPDTYLDEFSATTNFGTGTLNVGSIVDTEAIVLLEFDISDITAGSTITSATLELNIAANVTAGAGKLSRVLRTDWSELQATWTIYKTSNNWNTGGCKGDGSDYTSTAEITYGAPSGTGAKSFTGLGPLAQDAVDSRAGKLRLRMKADAESGTAYFQAYNAEDTSSNRPKLTVVFTAGAASPPPRRIFKTGFLTPKWRYDYARAEWIGG